MPGTGLGGYRNDENEREKIMKEGIHPNYREVCFMDVSNNFKFVTRSCVNTKEMVKMDDGRELPASVRMPAPGMIFFSQLI